MRHVVAVFMGRPSRSRPLAERFTVGKHLDWLDMATDVFLALCGMIVIIVGIAQTWYRYEWEIRKFLYNLFNHIKRRLTRPRKPKYRPKRSI